MEKKPDFYSVRSLLAEHDVNIENTMYRECRPDMLDFKIASGNFYEMEDKNLGLLRFKKSANLLSFRQIQSELPKLEKIVFRHKDFFPYYGENLDKIQQSLDEAPDSVCVEGGPCLFGEHEIMVMVTLRSGVSCAFDYSTGKRYAKQEDSEYADAKEADLAAFLLQHAKEVTDVRFENRKTGLTYQEYMHVFLPFASADSLGVSLVMTLPDFSYRKYLEASVAPLEPEMAQRLLAEFDVILYGISDMYLSLIMRLQNRFQIPNLTLVHRRNEEILRQYEEMRRHYIERNKVLRHLTNNPAKFESIKDYISRPALPFYLHGARTILEVNSMDETDSFRKCQKAHKSVLTMGCILFPELLSADGVNTLYCAPLKYKEYGSYESELE